MTGAWRSSTTRFRWICSIVVSVTVERGPYDDSCGGTWQQGWVRSLVPSARAQLGKLTRSPHPAVSFSHGTTYALELVVMDLAGSVRPSSLGGAFYFLGIMDVYTRYSWVFTLRVKSDAACKGAIEEERHCFRQAITFTKC